MYLCKFGLNPPTGSKYSAGKSSLASGSEFKENYCYRTKIFSDIISLLGYNTDSPIREVDTLRIKKNVIWRKPYMDSFNRTITKTTITVLYLVFQKEVTLRVGWT